MAATTTTCDHCGAPRVLGLVLCAKCHAAEQERWLDQQTPAVSAYADVPGTDPTVILAVGDAVRLRCAVDRYPHFVAPAGALGNVIEVTARGVAVELEQHVAGAETWDNCVIWSLPEDEANLIEQLEVI